MKDFIDHLIDKSAEANPKTDGDYTGDDGLLYCGKCNTPKQCKVHFPFMPDGELDIVSCNCKCKNERIEAARQVENQQKAKELIAYNRCCAFTDRHSETITFNLDENPENEISLLARNYAYSFDPTTSKGLVFYGGCGTGKSFLAACICNSIIDRGYTALFTSISEIESHLWNAQNGKGAIYSNLREYDLLVLDDFSTERKTEYMSEIAFNVIDNRYRSGKPLILTTNLAPHEFNTTDRTQQRIFSRLFEMTIPVKVIGNDKRKEILKSTMQDEINKIMTYSGEEESIADIHKRLGISDNTNNFVFNEPGETDF